MLLHPLPPCSAGPVDVFSIPHCRIGPDCSRHLDEHKHIALCGCQSMSPHCRPGLQLDLSVYRCNPRYEVGTHTLSRGFLSLLRRT